MKRYDVGASSTIVWELVLGKEVARRFVLLGEPFDVGRQDLKAMDLVESVPFLNQRFLFEAT